MLRVTYKDRSAFSGEEISAYTLFIRFNILELTFFIRVNQFVVLALTFVDLYEKLYFN